jgi:hypothetical protein
MGCQAIVIVFLTHKSQMGSKTTLSEKFLHFFFTLASKWVLYDSLKRIDSSAKDSILLALPQNMLEVRDLRMGQNYSVRELRRNA